MPRKSSAGRNFKEEPSPSLALSYLASAEFQLQTFRHDPIGKHTGEALRCLDKAAAYLMGHGLITPDGKRRGTIPDFLENVVSRYESVFSQFMEAGERFVIYPPPEVRH